MISIPILIFGKVLGSNLRPVDKSTLAEMFWFSVFMLGQYLKIGHFIQHPFGFLFRIFCHALLYCDMTPESWNSGARVDVHC
jgi:hypothetical protein